MRGAGRPRDEGPLRPRPEPVEGWLRAPRGFPPAGLPRTRRDARDGGGGGGSDAPITATRSLRRRRREQKGFSAPAPPSSPRFRRLIGCYCRRRPAHALAPPTPRRIGPRACPAAALIGGRAVPQAGGREGAGWLDGERSGAVVAAAAAAVAARARSVGRAAGVVPGAAAAEPRSVRPGPAWRCPCGLGRGRCGAAQPGPARPAGAERGGGGAEPSPALFCCRRGRPRPGPGGGGKPEGEGRPLPGARHRRGCGCPRPGRAWRGAKRPSRLLPPRAAPAVLPRGRRRRSGRPGTFPGRRRVSPLSAAVVPARGGSGVTDRALTEPGPCHHPPPPPGAPGRPVNPRLTELRGPGRPLRPRLGRGRAGLPRLGFPRPPPPALSWGLKAGGAGGRFSRSPPPRGATGAARGSWKDTAVF